MSEHFHNGEDDADHQLTKPELRRQKMSRDEMKVTARNKVVVILDSLKCAHNIGTILRLSDALLIEKVCICGDTIIPPNGKIKAGSRGSERWVPWSYYDNAIDAVLSYKGDGYNIVSCEVTSDSRMYSEVSYKFPLCLVVGREYDGVSPDVLAASDCVVSLPIYGMANSINVSTATSVVMYEINRQLQGHSRNREG